MRTLESVDRLSVLLTELARALGAGDSAAVLAAELPLAAAVQELQRSASAEGGHERPVGPALERRVEQLRADIARCRALGDAAATLSAIMNGESPVYGRGGRT